MTSVTTKPDSPQPTGETAVYLFLTTGLTDRRWPARSFVNSSMLAIVEGELDMALSRPRLLAMRSRRAAKRRRRSASPVTAMAIDRDRCSWLAG